MRFFTQLYNHLSLGALALLATPLVAAAQSGATAAPSGGTGSIIANPLNVNGICGLLKAVLNVAMALGVPIAMVFIAYAAFRLIWAQGNPEALNKARQNLMWVFIGIAIFLGLWGGVSILANTLGSLGVTALGDCH